MKSQAISWRDAILDIADAGMIGIEIMRLDVGGLVDGGKTGRLARVHQVERHFGLAVDHHRLAGGGLHVDAMARAAEGEFDPSWTSPSRCARAPAPT